MTRLPLLAVLAALLFSGCEAVQGKPGSVGPIPEILVLTDSMTWKGPVGDALRAELARPIATLPNGQGAFKLVQRELDNLSWQQAQRARGVVVAGLIDDSTAAGRFLRARIDGAGQELLRQGRARGVYANPNLWARDQLVVYATGATAPALVREIEAEGAALRAAFDTLAARNTETEMFSKARQTDAEAALLADKGWTLKVQHDYVQVQDTTATAAGLTGDFVRFRRVLTDTWRDFFVFAVDDVAELPDSTRLDAVTDSLLAQFALGVFDGSYVQQDPRRPVRRDTAQVGPYRAAETRGLWRMTEDLMGGAYVRYAFVTEDDRLFLYYGMIFSPDRTLDKREFLRQMEVIGTTIRTGDAAREAFANAEP